MQELNAVVLIAVIFVPSQFLLVSVLHILRACPRHAASPGLPEANCGWSGPRW